MAHPSTSTSSPAAPLGPKAAHYNTSLTAALLKGCWGDNIAGTAPNGTELGWGELVRKWGKHTGGKDTELVHRLRDISLLYLSKSSLASSGFISVPPPSQSGPTANTTVAGAGSTSRAGGSNASDETTTSASASSFIHIPHPHLRRHRSRLSHDAAGSGSSVTATQHGRGISPATGNRAAYLSAGDLDGDDPADGSGWSVRGWWSGIGSDDVEEAREGVKALEGLITSGKLRSGELQSADVILGYYLHALGSHEEAIRVLQRIAGDPKIGLVDGDAAVLDRIRAKYLTGLSAELQQSPDPQLALQSYTSIVPLAHALSTIPASIPSYLSTSSSSTKLPFETHRELHRIISSALCRAAILSARIPDDLTNTLRTLRSYHSFSASWPASFRPLQRQRMLQLYIRALYSGYPPSNTAPDSPYTLDATLATTPTSARSLWRKEAIEAIRQGRSLLSATTSFPRAGSINAPVTNFSNLCVALADRCADVQREVVNVLWWAMTLTFQSQSILRHLTRLQAALGDSTDARRTFELYVQLALKARETHQPEISLQLKRRVTDDHPAPPDLIEKEAAEAKGEDGQEGRQAQVSESELDSDENLTEALLVGSRLLLWDLGEVEDAWRYVCLAGDVVNIAGKTHGGVQLKSVLRGEMEESKGLVRMAMAMKGADRTTRPKYQAQAVNHLKAATELNSSSALAFYHLAKCQAQARSIDAAADSIRRSLEVDSRQVQSWHLLALILTAQKDWQAAAKAGEAGVNVWEQDEEVELSNEEASGPEDVNVSAKDFASAYPASTPAQNEPLLLASGSFHPPHIDSKPPQSVLTRAKRLENVIKLRMTLNVITEKMLGAEVAMLRQQELFAFFSARSGKNRASVGGGLGGLKGSASFTSVPGSAGGGAKEDLGGSYISINVDRPPASGEDGSRSAAAGGTGTGVEAPGLIASVQPPTPVEESPAASNGGNIAGTAPRPLGLPLGQQATHTPTRSAVSSVAPSTATSETDSPDDREKTGSSGKEGKDGRKLLGTKRLVAKHLHVPHGGSSRSSRPSSVRRLQLPDDSRTSVQRNRAASASSAALSVAPTAVHSHFRGANPTPPPPPPAQIRPASEHTPAESRILSNLWLMSAATFRRWSMPEQSLVAIEEAEVLDPENPDVWVQLGLYYLGLTPPDHAAALPAFTKAILLRPDHPPSLVNLAKLYLSTNKVELAHSLLNQMTQDAGWDVPEAWFYLGKVCEIQGRVERSRECWRYALELEETRPVRRWDVV